MSVEDSSTLTSTHVGNNNLWFQYSRYKGGKVILLQQTILNTRCLLALRSVKSCYVCPHIPPHSWCASGIDVLFIILYIHPKLADSHKLLHVFNYTSSKSRTRERERDLSLACQQYLTLKELPRGSTSRPIYTTRTSLTKSSII